MMIKCGGRAGIVFRCLLFSGVVPSTLAISSAANFQIGQLYNGRDEPHRWEVITRDVDAQQPFPPTSDSWRESDTSLWVGIASFRDERCGKTLVNVFEKAEFPERITVGVVQQNAEGDIGCIEEYCRLMLVNDQGDSCPFRDQIRVLEMDASRSQGPCWGRHFQSYLLADEEFCMQTDSHMDFVERWDSLMMSEWAATHNEYGVLSTYVHPISSLEEPVGGQDAQVPHLCEVSFDGIFPKNQPARALRNMQEPKLTTTWGAGYSFSKCHFERSVPYDPHLIQVFDGEEVSRMVRLWTHGYDVYTPKESFVVHDYNQGKASKTKSWGTNIQGSEAERKKTRQKTRQRLFDLMEMPRDSLTEAANEKDLEEGRRTVQSDPWGLGDRRTLDQFIEFTGFDLRHKSWIGTTGDRCGSGVEWVPYSLDGHDPAEKMFHQQPEGKGGGDIEPDNLTHDHQSVAVGAAPPKKTGVIEGIAAGPFWSEVKEKLEASGLDVWWDPRPEQRKAPISYNELVEDAKEEHQDNMDPAASDAVEVETSDIGEAKHSTRTDVHDDNAEEDKVVPPDVAGEENPFHDVDEPNAKDSKISHPGPVLHATTAGAEGRSLMGKRWTLLCLVGTLAAFWFCKGELLRRKATDRARGRAKAGEYVGGAFSPNPGAASPLGVTSFVWQGARKKDHHV